MSIIRLYHELALQPRLVLLNTIKKATIVAILFLSTVCYSQLRVKGMAKTIKGDAVPFASVLLLSSSDSSLVKGQMSNDDGIFSIEAETENFYFVSISAIGFHTETTKVFKLTKENSPFDLGTISISESVEQLDEAVVTADKPMFEQKIDRTIINVRSSISRAGGTALDVLQRSPGVTVDKLNNAIALSGKQGVMVMINGKISRLPMESVVQMLGGMNAENIERIELITTPPSKFEAQGDAGMINIVTKKMEDIGTNGSLSLFTGFGRRGKYGGTLNVNSRGKKFNFFGDLTFRDDHTRQYINTRWDVAIDNQINQTTSNNNRKAYEGVTSGGLGFDWNVGKKTTLSGLLNFFDSKWDMDALADINRTVDQNPFYKLRMNTIEKNDWRQILGNINLKHEFDKDFSMSIDLDRINYNSSNPTIYYQDYFNNQGSPTSQSQLRSRKDTGIDIFTSAIDFTKKISKKINLEFGSKGSFLKLNNDIVVDKLDNGTWNIDNGLTSYANMYENIIAGYTSVTINASTKFDIQGGLRYEHTRTNIGTRAQQNVVDRDYGNWFPSLFINNKINDNNSWVLSYSRRISRPSFSQLAPFVIFNDPNNFFSGNIALYPSFTDALKAEYKYKSVLLSLQYSYDKNAITRFQPRINSDNKLVSISQNLDYRENFSVSLSFPIQVTKWWEMQLNGIASSYTIKASYTDNPLSLSISNFSFNGSQKFKISKSISAEIAAFYQSPQLFGISTSAAFGALDFGIEKKFKNSSLRASFGDIFGTNKWRFDTVVPSENLNSYTYLDFETTIVNATYTYNFGNNKLKLKGPRKTGSKEEQERL